MSRITPPKSLKKPLEVPEKLMMGPGPSNYPQRVRDAMSKPILGHLHPETLQVSRDFCQVMTDNTNLCVIHSDHGRDQGRHSVCITNDQ